MVVAHVGLPVVWAAGGGATSDQCGPSPHQYGAPFSCAPKPHRRVVARRPGGGALRAAPTPCRVGSLDFRTQGCVKRLILPPDSLDLLEVRRSERIEGRGSWGGRREHLSRFTLLRSDAPFFRPGPDEQAYARHFAIRAVTARLLAIEPPASLEL